MSVIDRIKNNIINAIINRCSEKGCRLRLDGLNNYVVLKGERICLDRKICDCIIFTENDYIIIGIVELKGKTEHSSEIIEKLTNGSLTALDILERCSDDRVKFEFYHLVLCKSWHPSEYRVIVSRKIIVRGKKYDIIPKRCGVSFFAVISSLR
jgi:hypothetical protein